MTQSANKTVLSAWNDGMTASSY